MVGAVGFEPTLLGPELSGLTTCRHPNITLLGTPRGCQLHPVVSPQTSHTRQEPLRRILVELQCVQISPVYPCALACTVMS